MSVEGRPGMLAHNAVGSIIEMYAEILRGYEQREQLLRMQLEQLKTEVAALRAAREGG